MVSLKLKKYLYKFFNTTTGENAMNFRTETLFGEKGEDDSIENHGVHVAAQKFSIDSYQNLFWHFMVRGEVCFQSSNI